MSKINYIVYGHTSYLDVLEIQTDYICSHGDVILFINSNDLGLDYLYDKYTRVIFYNDSTQYANRLIHCLNQIDDEYFLLIHDIDILLNVNNETIESLYDFMKLRNVDRIDLKQSHSLNVPNVTYVGKRDSVESWPTIKTCDISEGVHLVKQEDPKEFIYNVNPSIWKRDSFLKLLNKFSYKTYRTIEDLDVQNYCTRFNIYKLYSKNSIDCGYFICLDIFKFLHISHGGKLLRLTDSFTTEHNQSYAPVSNDYIKIINNYNLKTSEKWRQ